MLPVGLTAHLDVLHEAVTFATAGQGLPSSSNGRKGDLHQLIHVWKTTQHKEKNVSDSIGNPLIQCLSNASYELLFT